MRLRDRTLSFNNITHHARVTQCLGAVGSPSNAVWYLGVAAPTLVSSNADGAQGGSFESGNGGNNGRDVEVSKCGHKFRPPAVEDVRVFRMEGAVVVKLHRGTWHAGPLFTEPHMDFYNLELADTNVRGGVRR